MAKPNLKLVTETADIYAGWKAEIAARDWERCHIRGDRNPPLEWWPRVRRLWRG